MAANPEVVEDTSTIVTYRLHDKPPLPVTALLGLQHTLAMFVGNITPPIIVAAALGFDVMTTAFIISMTLFTAGLSTWIQAKKIGPIGSGMCVVQGTSFLFIPLAIQAGQIGGWPLVLGMALATSPVEMILSRFMDQARKIFAPVVIGSFLTCSGLILMGAGMASLCGGQGVEDFGHPRYIALGLFVLALIVLFNRFGKGLVQTASIAIAIAAGYLVSIPMGLVDFSAISEAGWFMAPIPFKFGLSFTWTLLIPWIIAYILSGLECIGDLTGVAQSSGEPITGDIHKKRLEGGMMGDAVGSAIAAIFGTLPNITFTQNIGVIQLTKVGARVVGYSCGIILMILGLLPKIGALISIMPQPVLGGATIPMFGLVAVAGIRIVLSSGFTERNAFIFAISVAMGMGVNYYPEAVSMLPEWLEMIFAQPLATTAVFATALHLITPDQAAVQAKTAEVEA